MKVKRSSKNSFLLGSLSSSYSCERKIYIFYQGQYFPPIAEQSKGVNTGLLLCESTFFFLNVALGKRGGGTSLRFQFYETSQNSPKFHSHQSATDAVLHKLTLAKSLEASPLPLLLSASSAQLALPFYNRVEKLHIRGQQT